MIALIFGRVLDTIRDERGGGNLLTQPLERSRT
jgi:hypothetical protein